MIRNSTSLFLSKRQYTLHLIEDAGLLGAKPISVPIDLTPKPTASYHDTLNNATPYRCLFHHLLYLIISRSDVTFVVHKLSQYMTQPTLTHMNATNNLLKYLKGSPGQGIMLPKVKHFSIKAFAYSDWGSCPDTRRSTIGLCIFLSNFLKSWK